MTEDCGCKPKRRSPQGANAPRKFKYFDEIIWLLAGVLIAYVAIKFVAPSVAKPQEVAQPAVCNCAELEHRIAALEQHITRVDGKFHRSLNDKTQTGVDARSSRRESIRVCTKEYASAS